MVVSFYRTTTINAYAVGLRELWIKSFGEDHVLSINSVKKKLSNLVQTYHSQVYIQGM